jgi:endonuclease YncB( thermonuclease family)
MKFFCVDIKSIKKMLCNNDDDNENNDNGNNDNGNNDNGNVNKNNNESLEKLKNIKDDIKYFTFSGNTFYAKHCNIYDGDTFSSIFEYRGEFIKCRCYGYDCAEMKPSLQNENRLHEKELALKAKHRLEELLNKHETKLIKIECFGFDKYGRLLVNIWNMVDEKSINDIMIEEGHAKKYDGGKKDKWQ